MTERGGILLLAMVAAMLAGCGRRAETHPTTLQKVVLQTDWFPQGEHGGFYQALAKGYYRDAGLDVEIRPGGPGTMIKLSVSKGDADFGLYNSADMIVAASNLPVVMVAASLQHDPQALMVHADSPVKTFADLNGRSVTASPAMMWIPYLQKRYGITFSLTPQLHGLTGFFADKNSIKQCLVTNEPFYAAQRGVKVRTLVLWDSGYDGYHVIFARRALAKDKPQLVRAFVDATIRGWKDFLENDPEPAFRIILERNRDMSRELLNYSRTQLIERKLVAGDPAKGEGIGVLSPGRLQHEIDQMVEFGVLKKPLLLSDVVAEGVARESRE